jgi:hypothetical protein
MYPLLIFKEALSILSAVSCMKKEEDIANLPSVNLEEQFS